MGRVRVPGAMSQVIPSLRDLFATLRGASSTPKVGQEVSVHDLVDAVMENRYVLVKAATGEPKEQWPKHPWDICFTRDGGIAFALYNATGSPTVRGETVVPSEDRENGAMVAPVTSYDVIGPWLDDGVASGELGWVVMSGRGYLLTESGTGAALRNWVRASDVEPGRVFCAASPAGGFPAATAEHFRECGHCITNATIDELGVYAILHFL